MSSFAQDPIHRLLDRERDAYARARAVYDKYDDGLPDRDALPDRERALVDDLARAESAVRRMRAQRRAERADSARP